MKLFTWNLHSKTERGESPRLDTLNDAITLFEHHAGQDLLIGCLQETPMLGHKLRDYVELRSGKSLSCVPIEAKAHLIYSQNLRLKFARRDSTERAIVACFETPSQARLYIVGLHCIDQVTLSKEAARGGASALLRANLDELVDTSLPLIVAGDFNAEPTSQELISEYCFFARTKDHKMVNRHTNATGTRRRPLFVKQADQGTYYYSKEERWTKMDFFMVSDELKERVSSVQALTDIVGKSLLRNGTKGTPNPKISDHLPVMADIHFQ